MTLPKHMEKYYVVYKLKLPNGEHEIKDEITTIPILGKRIKNNMVYINDAKARFIEKLNLKHGKDTFKILEIFTDYEKVKSYMMSFRRLTNEEET